MINIKKNEMLLKDLYLKKLNMGVIQGPPTGNIFVDKIWSVNFYERAGADFNIYDTLYNVFRNYALSHLDDTVIYVQATQEKYTYGELLELIDKTSSSLGEMGIDEKSRVGLFLNSSIEDPVFLLALNKIGALSRWFDSFKDPKENEDDLNENKYDLLVVDEDLIPLEQMINHKNIQTIVANTKKIYNSNKYIDFAQFCQKECKKNIPAISFDERRETVIINSSGTTGPSKSIVHTDNSINAAAQKVMYTDYPLGNHNVIMKMVPSQIGMGLVTSMYVGLISGTQVALISGNSIEQMAMNMINFVRNFPQYIKDNNLPKDTKLNIMTAPIQIRQLIRSEMINDLSFIGSIMVGGSKMTKKELDELTEIGRKKGLRVPICIGYGQNELAGGASYNYNCYNEYGSAGFPAIGMDIAIVDPDTNKVLGVNQEGHILERSNSTFKCYDNQKEKTENASIVLEDGLKWFKTNDLGYMNEKGFIYITGRLGRVATRFDSKIYLDTIQEKIKTLPMIEDCAVICPIFGGSNEDIVAYIVTNYDLEHVKQIIKNANILSLFEMPTEFRNIEAIPYLSSGKPNYEMLKKLYSRTDKKRNKVKSSL